MEARLNDLQVAYCTGFFLRLVRMITTTSKTVTMSPTPPMAMIAHPHPGKTKPVGGVCDGCVTSVLETCGVVKWYRVHSVYLEITILLILSELFTWKLEFPSTVKFLAPLLAANHSVIHDLSSSLLTWSYPTSQVLYRKSNIHFYETFYIKDLTSGSTNKKGCCVSFLTYSYF